MPLPSDSPINAGAGRFIGGVFGFAFAGIGLTVLIFLWGSPFGQWDSPPLFFRVFGSFIALVFLAVGSAVFVTSIKNRSAAQVAATDGFPTPIAAKPAGTTGYACPHCGAPLPAKADVSPLGDAKCPFCHTWFNIHQKSA